MMEEIPADAIFRKERPNLLDDVVESHEHKDTGLGIFKIYPDKLRRAGCVGGAPLKICGYFPRRLKYCICLSRCSAAFLVRNFPSIFVPLPLYRIHWCPFFLIIISSSRYSSSRSYGMIPTAFSRSLSRSNSVFGRIRYFSRWRTAWCSIYWPSPLSLSRV